jgi:Zn-finger protein
MIIPGELFSLFLHYYHRKVKLMITHPRPIKFYFSIEAWCFKPYYNNNEIPKEALASLKKFFGQEMEPNDECLDIYRKRFIDRVLRAKLKEELESSKKIIKGKTGVLEMLAMGIEISEGELIGLWDFVTAMEKPLPEIKRKRGNKRAYSFGSDMDIDEQQHRL